MDRRCLECKVHETNGHLFGCSIAAAIAARRIAEDVSAAILPPPARAAAARDA